MRTNVYIDASNLFYGGMKSLGWRVDYEKLLEYFKEKYSVSRVFFFGGVEIHNFPFDYLEDGSVSVSSLEKYFSDLIKERGGVEVGVDLDIINRYLKRIRFYLKLEHFGYTLVLKPVKTFFGADGLPVRKANCDVDMAFYMISDHDMFDRVLVLSGDGDFLPALKFLRENGKDVLILARGSRTAREIRKFAAGNFRDFDYLRTHLEFQEKAEPLG
ncbi:MAG: NYN domain-containing protein [bacterium]